MATKVVMPQMGESITEGTIVRWFKQVGDMVGKDEPLLEISTDKVDAEVPSPAKGVLLKIYNQPGDTVAVDAVIAEIGEAGEQPAEDAPATPVEAPQATAATTAPPKQADPEAAATAAAAAAPPPRPEATTRPPVATDTDESEATRRRSSPLVRRIAAEHGVDLADVPGTGVQGRVTKADILSFVEGGHQATVRTPALDTIHAPSPARPAQPAAPAGAPLSGATLAPTGPFTGDEHREKLSVMRQKIAEHMVASRRTSPHVHTVFEVDMSRVVALRERAKDAFAAQHGLKLTFTPFFMAATVQALQAYPVVNAALDGDEIVYHRHVHLGVAVALDRGLIVPVVRNAEEKSLVGLQRAITDLAARARGKQLKPEEVGGSTFSITNPGPYGGLYGLPIINQPNVAILSTGGIHRRPLVVTDEEGREAIAIRDVAYLALSFDHRLIDGATADMFMARLKQVLEEGAFELG